MKLHHKQPCAECPWRKASPPSWLGGHAPEFYADAVQNSETPACHLRDHGPDDDDTAYCIGALVTMANQCILPQSPDAIGARQIVGKRDDCFAHVALFYKHHADGADYVHPLLRRSPAHA